MAGGRQINRDPLPVQVRKIRYRSFSIVVSNHPQQISKTELEAMFRRAGRITDVFIPVDKRGNSYRGFASVRFPTLKRSIEGSWISIREILGWKESPGQHRSVQLQQKCERGTREAKGGLECQSSVFFSARSASYRRNPKAGESASYRGQKWMAAFKSSRVDSGRRHRKRS